MHCVISSLIKCSFQSALLNHMLARAQAARGDFRAALASEKETYMIYSHLFGAEHDRTKESGECLKHLTQQAVLFQKRMNEAAKGNNIHTLLPVQVREEGREREKKNERERKSVSDRVTNRL